MKKTSRSILCLLVQIMLLTSLLTACGNEAGNTVTTEATNKTPVEIKVMMIGDMLIHSDVYKSGFNPKGIPSNYDHFFANILPEIKEADISIVNQETPLGGKELGLSDHPSFNGPQEIGDSMAKAGFNVILHATNHFLDKGLTGAQATINYWREKHPEVAYLGVNNSAEDINNIYVYEKEGFKIAILNYTYGANGFEIPVSAPYIINTFDDETRVRNDIKNAHTLADMVIVCPHWGTEYAYRPDDFQKKWTQIFLEEKVDLVLGTHPQVLENVEKLTSTDGHEMVVYYSLGNFVSSQNYIPRILGGMAKVTLIKDGDKAYIKTYEIDPLITHRTTDSTFTTYKLSDYTDDLLAKNIINSDHAAPCTSLCQCGAKQIDVPTHGIENFNLAYCKKLCKYILGDMYKE